MGIGELLEVIEEVLLFFFLLTFYFEITVDPHAVVKNTTEIPYGLYPASPKVTSCITIVQYHNRMLIDINTVHSPDETSPVVLALFCVCVFYAVFFTSVDLCEPPSQSRDKTAPSQESLMLPLYSHSHLPQPLP